MTMIMSDQEYQILIATHAQQPMMLLDAVRKKMMTSKIGSCDYVFWRAKYEELHDKAVHRAYMSMRLM